MKLYVDGIGLRGPGLPDWAAGRKILADKAPYLSAETILVSSPLLPSAEGRRMPATVKLALAVGGQAVEDAGMQPAAFPSVFTSSGGDGDTITAILEALAVSERQVSPTRFHNSVHNAPSGYWSIANHSREPSVSLCIYDFSFAAGLLEAASQALTDHRPVLLVSYDLPYPPPLHAARPIVGAFGVALILSPRPIGAKAIYLSIEIVRDGRPETAMLEPELEALRVGNPSARALPILAAIARGANQKVVISHVGRNLLALDVSAAVSTT